MGGGFLRWLRGRKKSETAHSARQLPALPTNGEYGFHDNHDKHDSHVNHVNHDSHVYEEIVYEEMTSVKCGNDGCGVADAEKDFDLRGARRVGGYLLVPLRRGDEQPGRDDYTSLYSMLDDWAKLQISDSNNKRRGFAVSRGYSVDPPISDSNHSNHHSTAVSSNLGNRRYSNPVSVSSIHSNPTSSCHSNRYSYGQERPVCVLEKSHDSGHGSDDSDSDGYLKSVSGKPRRHSEDFLQSGLWSADSLSDLEVFADDIEDDTDYFILHTEPKPVRNRQRSSGSSDVYLTTVSEDNTSPSNPSPRRSSQCPRNSQQEAGKYHVEAEALIDKLFQSSREVRPSNPPRQPPPKTDRSTGLSVPSLRSRDHVMTSQRMSVRARGFDRNRRSVEFGRKVRTVSCSSSGDSDSLGSVYGPVRPDSENRFLQDVLRRNYDSFMNPFLHQ